MRLFLKPGLLLNDQLLRTLLLVLIEFHLLLAGEFLAQPVRFSVLTLLHQALEDLLVLE